MTDPRDTYEWKRIICPAIKQRDGYRCVACGTGNDLTVDHIKPVSKYPELWNVFSNLRTMCRSCNSSKGNRTAVRTNYVNQNWLDSL